MNILGSIRPVFVARASSTVPSAGAPRPAGAVAPATRPPSPAPARPGAPSAPAAPATQPASPVFLTLQSLASFPGAALAINILWNLVAVLNKDVAQWAVVPLGLALIVGAMIYLISITATMPLKEKILGGAIAFINSAWLGLNALGVNIVKAPVP